VPVHGLLGFRQAPHFDQIVASAPTQHQLVIPEARRVVAQVGVDLLLDIRDGHNFTRYQFSEA